MLSSNHTKEWLKQVLPLPIFSLLYYLLSTLPDGFYSRLNLIIAYKQVLILSILLALAAFWAALQIPRQKKSIRPLASKPEKSGENEKFHTFNGITFKYNSSNGIVFQYPYCPKDKIEMEEIMVMNRVIYKCFVCKTEIKLDRYEFTRIRDNFERIIASHIKGHLPELPKESEKDF